MDSLKQALVDYRAGSFQQLSSLLYSRGYHRGEGWRRAVDCLGHGYCAAANYLLDTRLIEIAIASVINIDNGGRNIAVDDIVGSMKYSDNAIDVGIFNNYQDDSIGLTAWLHQGFVVPRVDGRDCDVLDNIGDGFNEAVKAKILPVGIVASVFHVVRQFSERENNVEESMVLNWAGSDEVPANVLILDKYRNDYVRKKSKNRASPGLNTK